jgi:hypothetical protein
LWYRFVQQILELATEHGTAVGVEALAKDDLFFFTHKMLEKRQSLWPPTPTNATVAYHYTRKAAISTIRTEGLLTHPERQKNATVTDKTFNGAALGDGACMGHPFKVEGYICEEVRRAGPLASSVQVTLRRVCSCRAGGCVLTTRAWDAGIYTGDNPYSFLGFGGAYARPCPPCSTSCLQGVPTPRGTGGV